MLHVCAVTKIENDFYRILMLIPGIMSAHFSIEYRTHFTNYHCTVIGLFGATEQLLLIQLGTVLPYFLLSSNASWDFFMYVPYLEMDVGIKDVLIIFTFLSGMHYNLENIYSGYC